MKVTENQKLTNTVVLFKFFMKFSSISSESLKVLGYGHYSWMLIEFIIELNLVKLETEMTS